MQGSKLPATSWPSTRGAPPRRCAAPSPSAPGHYWSAPRDASLNWLALGLLLAAWNAADDRAGRMQPPEHFRGHAYVSVRAARQAALIR